MKTSQAPRPKIAVILPSRGLAFSETIEEVLRELDGYDYKIFWSHGRSVPQCLNVPTNEALRAKSFSHFWYVDDDMILPKGILKEMLDANVHAIAADYPSAITMGAAMYDPNGRAYFCGNGCLLVTRETLEKLKKPIWRSDVSWQLLYHNDCLEFKAGSANPDKVYGGHDVHFGISLYTKGMPLYITRLACGQRKISKQADMTTNNGAYKIDEWRKFHPNVFYIIDSQQKRDNSKTDNFIRVLLKDGTEAFATVSHANKLFEMGVVDQVGHAIFTNWDINKEQTIHG